MRTLNEIRKELKEVIELIETCKNEISLKELLLQEDVLMKEYKEAKNR